MKSWFLVFSSIIVCLIFLFTGCFRPHTILYHSEAGLPYSHYRIKTEFTLVSRSRFSSLTSSYFGVISAKDNDSLSYVLIAHKSPTRGIELAGYYLHNSVTLLPNQADEFISVLKESLSLWNVSYNSTEGINLEYSVAPENLIIPESPNVNTWYPTLNYYFTNVNGNSSAKIFMGGGFLRYYYELNRYEEISELIDLLESAI